MWKKEGSPEQPSAPRTETGFADRPAPRESTGERATIGRSITIRGEVTGNEDLLIQGRVEGSVSLAQHAVTVGADGEVRADISGRIVVVEGTVQGNLTADEQVVLRSSAVVQGDITAPRVMLEDGARFRGAVDMGEVSGRSGGRSGGEAARIAGRPEAGATADARSSEQTGASPLPA